MTKYADRNRAVFFLILALQSLPCLAEEYHIDSQQQFDALRAEAFRPGDIIWFKRRAEFNGMFSPSGNGTEKAPIRIDTYGEGNRPTIHASGRNRAGLLLQDSSFWEVNGLEITNTDGTDSDQGRLFGINVLMKGAEGTYEHIHQRLLRT